MKRSVYVLVTALALAGILLIMGTTSTINYVNRRLTIAEEALELLLEHDYAHALEKLSFLREEWREDRTQLAVFIDHRHLDSVQQSIIAAEFSCTQRNPDALSQCAVLCDLIRHLPDLNRLKLENFF